MALSAHARDAATMALTYDNSPVPVLGIHDAIGMGVNGVEEAGVAINKNFLEVMKKTSMIPDTLANVPKELQKLTRILRKMG